MARILILLVCIYTSYAQANIPLAKGAKLDNIETRLRALRQGGEPPVEEDTTVAPDAPDEPKKEQNCICSKIYDPVCADNGKSYYNLCHMECDINTNRTLTVVHQGNCIPF